MIEPIPSRVAVLESQVKDIKETTQSIDEKVDKLIGYMEREKGKTSTGRYIGHVVSVFFGGIAGALTSHIKLG